jgi:CRP-like cAMP-binding protein
MTQNEISAKLIQIGIPAELLQPVLNISTLKTVRSQHKLIEVGQLNNEIFIVLKGSFVSQYVHPETGDERTINFFMVNYHPFMTLIDAYFSGSKSFYRLKAVSNACILVFPKNELLKLREDNILFRDFYDQSIITGLVQVGELMTKLIVLKSVDFYNYLIAENPMIIQSIPSKYIAEFMGISREWLSKLKNKR